MCSHCFGRGLIRVAYKSGQPFDLALCVCGTGLNLRKASDEFIRQHFGVSDAVHRIGLLEDFSDDTVWTPDFTEAGRKPVPRPKL